VPIKIFILNNQYLGMVRQWQSCCMAGAIRRAIRKRCRTSSSSPRPYHGVGIRCEKPGDLDHAIKEMINVTAGPSTASVDQNEKLLPDDPSGKAHNEMILGDAAEISGNVITAEGKGGWVMNKPPSSSPAHYPAAPPRNAPNATHCVLVDNEAGVLARVVGLSRDAATTSTVLTVSETEHEKHLSRIPSSPPAPRW